MPTRSLGDFRLKHSEFNQHEFSGEKGYRPEMPNYTGPYITHKPDIQVHPIDPHDKYMVIASDGLWDEMKLEEVKDLFELNKDKLVNHSEMYRN